MSQKTTIISGIVKDSGGTPIPQARVYFTESPVPMPDIAALTNDDGEFSISLPAPGTYKIECAAEGFSSAVSKITAVSGKQEKIEISLKKMGNKHK